MSKGIRSYPLAEQKFVVARRLREKAGGLGTLAAAEWSAEKATKGKDD